jgi:hypothetical protein
MRKYERLQKRIHGNLPRSQRRRGLMDGRSALSTSLIAGQQSGPIRFGPWSVSNFKPTPIKRGEKVTLVPKVQHVLTLKTENGLDRYRKDEKTGQIWRVF